MEIRKITFSVITHQLLFLLLFLFLFFLTSNALEGPCPLNCLSVFPSNHAFSFLENVEPPSNEAIETFYKAYKIIEVDKRQELNLEK